MSINAENTKKFADAYYGAGNVVGDGTILKKLMEILMGLIGGCPLGARRAHSMVNGGPVQQNRAQRKIWWAVYDETGDEDRADDFAAAAVAVGKGATVEEFADFAKP